MPLLKLFESNPDFTVLYNGSKKLSAASLLGKSASLAAGLAEKGFGEKDVAVIAAQPGEEFLEIMYAVIMLKGQIAIIDPEMGKQNYASKMKQLNPRWMFIDSRLLFLQEHPVLRLALLKIKKTLPEIILHKGTRLVSVGMKLPVFRKHTSLQKLIKNRAAVTGFPDHEGHEEILVVYTSGTLAIPKGVMHTGKNLAESICRLSALLADHKNALVGTYLPHFMLLGIASGLPVKLLDPTLAASEKIRWIEMENIGVIFGPPSDYLPMIRLCETGNRILPGCLVHIIIGSAPVHINFLERLIAVLPKTTRITCTYGMTENLLVSTIDGREKVKFRGDGDIAGKSVDGVAVKIEADGEIMVRSPQMYSRYFHEKNRNDWHATGDLGTMDDHGNIILLGRKKEMIIRRNMNIYPALYENTIKHIKGVDEAAMVGIYDEDLHDEKVYLAVEGEKLNIDDIRKQLVSGAFSIDKEALPDKIIQMKIPRKGRQHKIDRAAIVADIKKYRL